MHVNNKNITIDHDFIKTLDGYRSKLAIENFLRIIMAFQNASLPLKKMLGGLSSNTGEESLTISDVIQIVKEGFDSYSFIKSNEETRQFISENEIKLLEYANILAECDWTPFRNDDIEHVNRIIAIWQQDKKPDKIDTAMTDYFIEEKLLSLYDNWCSKLFLKKRLHILREAIHAHINEQYYLSMPIILSQLEGMIADIYNHKGEMHEPAYKAYLKELINTQNFESYDKLYDSLFAATIMVSFQHGTKLTSQLSRHAILHGASVTYGTARNSLKLMLFFDLIQDCAKYCCYNDNKKFHLIGCSKVRKVDWISQKIDSKDIKDYTADQYYQLSSKNKTNYFKKKIVLYNNYEEAAQLKSPCKCCVQKYLVN